jgi:hypothetical protein
MDAGRISTNTYTEWWMEGYTTIGTGASSCYFAVTYTDGSTGQIAVTMASTLRQSRMFKILSSVGKTIQSITGATLQSTTGTAGSWGVTVSRPLFTITPAVANIGLTYDFAQTGMAMVSTNACLWWRAWQATTATGVVQANVKLIMG